ncbi:hypothetical protein E2986_02370 [Frieseomelitta varia]|uniref:Uncharacterized protein n=1 Tax=Frieseomelitta varia TaxID=561572 RepID=A0A833S3H1_9HYME|nr:hypothetical protein E2986_02370 [Frieseomelitta varia]
MLLCYLTANYRTTYLSSSYNPYRNDFLDDLDYMYDRGIEDDFEDDFVVAQRRYKERAAAAFADDLADLRRKRRDMQDRLFDVIDLNAEIEKARNTLGQADIAFQRHATKFDNSESNDDVTLKKFPNIESLPEKPVPKTIKFIKVPNVDIESCMPQPVKSRQNKINSIIEPNEIANPLNTIALLPLKRKFSNKKKTVSF